MLLSSIISHLLLISIMLIRPRVVTSSKQTQQIMPFQRHFLGFVSHIVFPLR